LGDLYVDRITKSKWAFKEGDFRIYNEFNCFRAGFSGGLL
jgi:hypothetical protein